MIVPFFFIVNDIEICFHGMARSGNHAVIDWISSMSQAKVDYWNNVAKCPMKLGFRKKYFLIRSHENRSLAEMSTDPLERYHDLYFGKTGKRFNVLLLRDPFNLFASRLQQQLNQGFNPSSHGFIMGHPRYKYGAHEPETFVEIWKNHAREFLATTSYLQEPKIVINYNRWFLDQDYRKQIASALELHYSDRSINRVVGRDSAGAGSSFDSFDYSGKGSEMKVLERWKKMSDNANYRSLFEDEEVWMLSEQIFGHLPETECLRPEGMTIP